jgi:exonuclease III
MQTATPFFEHFEVSFRLRQGWFGTHTRTKFVQAHPGIPYQDDYLFASKSLADRLDECHALPVDQHSPSDHAPIVASFDV